MTTKVRRTTIVIEVLHPESFDIDSASLGEVHEECLNGDSSLYWHVCTSSPPLTSEELQEDCGRHGIGVDFFGSDGEDADAEETFDTTDFQE